MTARSLVDALCTDVRAKFAVIRGISEIRASFESLSESIRTLRQSIESEDSTPFEGGGSRQVMADLLTVEAFLEHLDELIGQHGLAIGSGLFGASADHSE